eukprot:jgi/Mesvir1/23397/Mv21091-RA.2
MTGLLRKVSNEIINRCCVRISLPEIFNGHVEACMLALRESIRAGEAWKRVFHTTAQAVSDRAGSRKWDFNVSSIFAHIDAFTQRCRDLLEVCEAQTQFAPKTELPAFGGTRGPEITKSLTDIQASFQKLVQHLRGLNYSILDVKSTRWHDDYNTFKNGVKDLEVMMQNVIMLAFDSVSALSQQIELLEAFHSMAQRESIKLCVQKKTADVYAKFLHEVNVVKKHFDQFRRNPPISPSFPAYSGAAMWASSLLARINQPMALLTAAATYLPATPEAAELEVQHTQLSAAVEQFIRNQHTDWFQLIDPSVAKRLENTLIVAEEETGLLEMNFDKSLLSLFSEVLYFERLGLEIPYAAMEVTSLREKFRVLRENVLLVVRDYNNILLALDTQERRLFADRIRYLDRRIHPGLHKLNWISNRHHLEYFVKEARRFCAEVQETVVAYKAANDRIIANCRLISESVLVHIEKKRVYENGEFEAKQVKHREAMHTRFEAAVKEIKETMAATYETFANDSDEVQREWVKYTNKIDKRMDEALKTTVKKSLQELSRALNGDVKTEVIPLFNVIVVLERNKVELRPTVQDMFNMIHTASRELITVVSTVPRLVETRRRPGGAAATATAEATASAAGAQANGVTSPITSPGPSTPKASANAATSATAATAAAAAATAAAAAPGAAPPGGKPALPSFFTMISNDEDTTLKTIVSITTGITSIVDKVQQFLAYWEKKYKHIWDQDKEAYIRRYEKAKKSLSAFNADISKYKELQDEIQAEDTITNMRFLRIDCGPLKQSLVGHCDTWVNKFTGLLNTLAANELSAIHSYFATNLVLLKKQPVNLDMLADSVNLLRQLMDEASATEARFAPIIEKYQTLEKFEVVITSDEQDMLDRLPAEWAAFQLAMQDTEADLARAKENFRDKLAKMVDTFLKEVTDQREDFVARIPMGDNVSIADAFKFIQDGRDAVEAYRKKELELKAGMDIFRMEQPAYVEMAATEKDLELLEAMWSCKKEWETAFSGWKDGLFRELQVEELDEAAQRFSKKLTKLGRDIKHWPVWHSLKDKVDAFKKTMPLVTDLRNPAMRPRHWDSLMEAIGERFDPTGPDFTLAKVTELHLENFADQIGELSVNASKELAIEQALASVKETWQTMELDMGIYNEAKGIYKLRSTEEVFATLEENIVTLSTVKASRFFVVFEKETTTWEQQLSLVSETIEMVLAVQRQWMYLENVFIGSEDIRKQLPAESAMFEGVNDNFIRRMKKMQEAKLVLKATVGTGMLEAFSDMAAKLEKIQRSLENYLEKKRQQFPRFYFLSSDDLLEILGQAKDPLNVQPHLKKCFEGIKKLEIHLPGTDGRRNHESTGIFSPDGEYLPLQAPVLTEGRPEDWLNKVEAAMFLTTKKHLFKALEESKTGKKEKWLKECIGQCVISAGQIVWTNECERALAEADKSKSALRQLKKKWISYLNKLTGVTRSQLTKVDRLKTVSLITIEVHARDVIEKLGKVGCSSVADFEWSSQLRFYWDRDSNECVIKQVLSLFVYGYEYQGNNGRLVITPLTDRCYMTLGAAMFTRRGGNPLGPAGTGKTETVKDFGKALARYVIVFNCSDGVDYKMTGKMFSGLAQTGAWACLDEFNRIEVEVLSVVASQIACVMNAMKAGLQRFVFEGVEIRLIPTCGVFVTMNPGYAGRSELPDNLKAIVRPVSMMVPDFTLIAEIMMFSEGFQTAKILSKKMIAIMELSQQQLSKQDHYDYGLRSFVIPIARAAGAMKRADPEAPEEVIMYRTMKDLIMPKLVYVDLPLFIALLSDLFPGVEMPPPDDGALIKAIELELKEGGLQVVDAYVKKLVQIFDCKVSRHGNMIVGKTGSGKSEAWKTLTRAMARLKREGVPGEYEKVHVHTINPLALSNDEIYGSFEESTHEWSDGVLARIMRTVCKDESSDQKWILFDGPVDTLWIESMNTLLDDNKLLTLLSGERISMPPQVSILFEVEDLSQASPATVSRAGMIYLNVEDLGWWPLITSWMERKRAAGTADAVMLDIIKRMLEVYVDKCVEFVRKECHQPVPMDRLNAVTTFTYLFDSLATKENSVSPEACETPEQYVQLVELWVLFCIVWSLGASVDEEGRRKFDAYVRELDPKFPATGRCYDYYVDSKKRAWVPWEEKLSANYRPKADTPFFRIMVPTVDTVCTRFIVSALVEVKRHCLVVGGVGVGKTMGIQTLLANLPEGLSSMTINMSAQTSSNSLQNTIEGRLEKRTKGVFAPAGGKRLVAFIDDLNMPQKSVFGFMPPLELLKLWIDNGFWYDREKQEVKHIKDMQLLAAMAPPGGGRNAFSQRIQACFSLVNMTQPSTAQMKRIFGSMLSSKLADFEDEIKPLGDILTQCSIQVYNTIQAELLPTPSKSHYLFNMRDMAKVIQGIMQATRAFYDSKEAMLQLWCHETFRVFGDRMWDMADKAWLQALLDRTLTETFELSWRNLFEGDGRMPPFVTFMREGMDNPPYEPVIDGVALKAFLTEKLEDYSLEPGNSAMDLVLFRDALEHVCRIHRVLNQPRGNMLLVGVGGSGRKSLARLAAFVAGMKVFSIEITKSYRVNEFHEDLKALYRQAGGAAPKPTAFLFDDTQIVTETFLEDVNNILASGEVPNLFAKDEMQGILEELRPIAKREGSGETADALYALFLERVRANLHVVLCLSPIGDSFRNRLRMFPGLVNCMTIDWFIEWPADALDEVSHKLLEDEDFGGSGIKDSVCKVFITAHMSVIETSARMLAEVKRYNYVTPTNFLEFVMGYQTLLKEKREEIGSAANKLRGGLQTLDDTRAQVADMQVVCQQKKIIVAKAKRDCEELLVEIVQEKRVVDEQEKQVNAEAQKIEKEAAECNAIADECQVELDKAMPALQAATDALNVLTKKDLSEVKAYSKPPALVELTLTAVMTVLKRPPTWEEAKKQLGDASFLEKLVRYDKDQLQDSLLKKIAKYTTNPDFTPDSVGKVSTAAKGLCLWVGAMEVYGHIAKEVAPKKAKLKSAQEMLAKKQAALKQAQDTLAEVLAKVAALKDKYETSTASKEALQKESDELEIKLERAEKLVSGLAGEKSRWEASISTFEEKMTALPGDCLVAAGFLSYAGPFPSEYRESLVKNTWLVQVRELSIPASPDFDFSLFLANPSDVRDWNIQGLPPDAFSTENGVLVTRGRRWPLMVDPQGQANKWIQNMEARSNLKVLTLSSSDLMRSMEAAIQFGSPVLLQDVAEEIDPALEPILAKAFIKRGNQVLIKLGDKELDYNPNFKLYITSKMPNPHYTPEVSTKATIVNFSVKESGLESQLLNIVVQRERPDLDKQKNELVVKVAHGKRTQKQLEDAILHNLSSATGSLLDNVELINTLDRSKTTWEEVNESLKVAEETAVKIETAAAAYKPCAVRASVLYFVLNDLGNIDPMYQFSLDAYIDLFLISIAKSQRSESLAERIRYLNDYHTYAVYRYTSRALFESHKLLLSLQMCVKVLQTSNQVSHDEFQFFLRGGTVLDKSAQPHNPAPHWISEEMWDNITELERLPQFAGVTASFETGFSAWEEWYRAQEPETTELPGDWESKCSELERMIFVRSLRPDRVIFAVTSYVSSNLGRKFVEPPVLDLNETYGDSIPTAPLIFVLSPGVDPTSSLRQLAASRGMESKFHSIALGQGQAPIATRLIDEGVAEGNWVFLANCHLMTSWLPTLDKIIRGLEHARPHENFRLWLSSNPTAAFPISILQRGMKLTTEPPKGLRANMIRLYNATSEARFTAVRKAENYARLYFALCYFHSVLLERRKFKTLGFNIPYDFNDTDFQVSDDLLGTYIDEYAETPWSSLKYLIAEANYGGRVTDELDRRVLHSYLNHFYCEEALTVPNYTLSPLAIYYIPDHGPLQSYKDYLQTLPMVDRPEAFGQHPNADISFQIADTHVMLEGIVSLQPRVGGDTGGVSREDAVHKVAEDLLAEVPELFDLEDIIKAKKSDASALHVILFQEIERYNVLLKRLKSSCTELIKGIKGLVVMSQDLELIFQALYDAKVPALWLKTYPSLKPLGPWMRELLHRVTELRDWVDNGYPKVYWLSGFTYPTGFLTAVLQTTARRNQIPIDTLSWEFTIVMLDEKEIMQPPKEGVYVRGMFLEGAGWDYNNGCLTEPKPMELVIPMPIVHFKPVENKKKSSKGMYSCPLYMYPVRTGTRERPSFMINVDLKSGSVDPDHWIKRGTALLLSLAS